jgi:hypothetical protein
MPGFGAWLLRAVYIAEPISKCFPSAHCSVAVYSAIGAHRIIHLEENRRAEWVVEGRLAHHTSHAPSHHPKQ